MRFLCLHGRGTNSEIFKDQTAKIRAALSEDHEFVFLNGNVQAKPPTSQNLHHLPDAVDLSDVPGLIPDKEVGKNQFGYWPLQSGEDEQYRLTYYTLRAFIQSQGPFAGLLGFSEGASVAATILIEDMRRHGASLGIGCAIFFCGAPPLDLDLGGTGRIRVLESARDGVLLRIPTAHIWCDRGDWLPGLGKDLVALCDETTREEVVHGLGHDCPGSRSDEGLRETMRAIRRTIEKAKTSC